MDIAKCVAANTSDVGVAQDGADVECAGGDLTTLELSSSRWCSPLILPLFRSSATVEMGHNISWACRWDYYCLPLSLFADNCLIKLFSGPQSETDIGSEIE